MCFSLPPLGSEAREGLSLILSVHDVSAEQGSGLNGVIVRSSAGTGSYFPLLSYVLRFVFISYCGDLFPACCKCLHGIVAAVFQERFALHRVRPFSSAFVKLTSVKMYAALSPNCPTPAPPAPVGPPPLLLSRTDYPARLPSTSPSSCNKSLSGLAFSTDLSSPLTITIWGKDWGKDFGLLGFFPS